MSGKEGRKEMFYLRISQHIIWDYMMSAICLRPSQTTFFHLPQGIFFTCTIPQAGRKEGNVFYLTTHSIHSIYGYMASDIWLRTILIVRKETHCRHIGYSFQLAARVLLYAPSHRQDSTYHGLGYTCRGTLAGTRNSSMGPPHEGSIRRPITNALTTELHLAPHRQECIHWTK